MNIFYSRGDRVEIAAESLPCIIAISVYDETWICLTSPGQHKGLNSKRGTQGPSWRRAQLRSTSQPPPAYCCSPGLPGYEPPPSLPYFNHHPPLTPSPPPSLLLWQASSASQSYPTPTPNICPVYLICPSRSLNSMWRQHYGLSCEHSFHSVTELLPSWFSDPPVTVICVIFYLPSDCDFKHFFPHVKF